MFINLKEIASPLEEIASQVKETGIRGEEIASGLEENASWEKETASRFKETTSRLEEIGIRGKENASRDEKTKGRNVFCCIFLCEKNVLRCYLNRIIYYFYQ